MIIADEHIDARIITSLRNIPVEVISVLESHRGIDDEEIIVLSKPE